MGKPHGTGSHSAPRRHWDRQQRSQTGRKELARRYRFEVGFSQRLSFSSFGSYCELVALFKSAGKAPRFRKMDRGARASLLSTPGPSLV